MDCKDIEKILVDYIEDFSDDDERLLVESHLAICTECSAKIEEYRYIKSAFASVKLPEVSPAVIDNLKAQAQRNRKDNKPFWKKWFYSPVLIPALSTAIALMVWIDYRHDQHNYPGNSGIFSRDVTPQKLPQVKSENSAVVLEPESDMASNRRNSTYEMDDTPHQKSDLRNRESSKKEITEIKGTTLPENGRKLKTEKIIPAEGSTKGYDKYKQPSIKSPAFEENTDKFSDNEKVDKTLSVSAVSQLTGIEDSIDGKEQTTIDRKDLSLEESGRVTGDSDIRVAVPKAATKTDFIAPENFNNKDARLKKPEPPQVLTDRPYIDALHEALRQQETGDCESAIKTHEDILQNIPAPSNKIREQCYKSLAECYEMKKEYAKAIENYNLLQIVAPSQNVFAMKKIQELNLKLQNMGK